jgi:hypothetical protein
LYTDMMPYVCFCFFNDVVLSRTAPPKFRW